MSEPRIVSPEEAQRYLDATANMKPGQRVFLSNPPHPRNLAHTVATEPDRALLVEQALELLAVEGETDLLNAIEVRAAEARTEPDRTRAAVVKALRDVSQVLSRGYEVDDIIARADEIENGAPL